MANGAGFTINGMAIKNPSSWKVEVYTLTKSTRVANGDMVMDFVANKRKFILTYAQITNKELNPIIEQVWTNLVNTRDCFHNFTYPDGDGVLQQAKVYAGSIPRNLHRGSTKLWVWKDVSFSLIER